MRLERLSLRNFRNYPHLELSVPPGVVVFIGDNGQGKTNLVEAIHLLLRGESFRAGTVDTFVRQTGRDEEPAALIKGTINSEALQHDLEWRVKPGHKSLLWNGKKTTGVQLASVFPIVLFSPESLASIKEGPDFRRRLIDDVLISHSPVGAQILKEFRKALQTRNRVLKNFKQGKANAEQTYRLLESLDPIFLPLGAELTSQRLNALKAIEPELQNSFRSVLETDAPVEVEYLMSGQKINDWPGDEIIDAMHQRASQLRPRELDAGITLVGPQRHDIRFLFAGKDSRYFCSQGQQRALILSYKMAQIMYHHRTHQVFPLLLLDDVLSELDPDRRTNLMRFLKVIPSQIFLTTTDLSLSPAQATSSHFGDRDLSVFRIENGVIASAGNAEGIRRNIDSSP